MTNFLGCFAEPSENGRAAAVSRRHCNSERQETERDCLHRAFGRHCFGREDQNPARRPSQFESQTRRRRPAQSMPGRQIRKEVTHDFIWPINWSFENGQLWRSEVSSQNNPKLKSRSPTHYF